MSIGVRQWSGRHGERCAFLDGRQGTESLAVVFEDGRRAIYRYCPDHAEKVTALRHQRPVARVEPA